MKILYLTLNKKWFDMILSGEKKEEYREIKEYWRRRLSDDKEMNSLKNFDFIEFTNGYSPTSRKMIVECKGIEMNSGKTEWGAVNDEFYFVIKLGKITDTKNCNNKKEMQKSIIELEKERMEWALKTFPEATAISSLRKLEGEIKEVEERIIEYPFGHSQDEELHEEYADCMMCILDSAGRLGITPEQILEAFEKKVAKNKSRKWRKNEDNTYSHIKK